MCMSYKYMKLHYFTTPKMNINESAMNLTWILQLWVSNLILISKFQFKSPFTSKHYISHWN